MSAVTMSFAVTAEALPSDVLLSEVDHLSVEADKKRDAILRHRVTLAVAMRQAGYDTGYLSSAGLSCLPDAINDALSRVRVESLTCRLQQLLRRIDRWHELLLDIRNMREDAAEMKEWCSI
ncbi:MAG: hypothetical protein O2931_06265 [Planctomycetota bacterium]|nr:hypothetical protein [Verrucomicrobiota bacterium]MDA1178385.1 hypothetical protein [Planctomycetota bacterium]